MNFYEKNVRGIYFKGGLGKSRYYGDSLFYSFFNLTLSEETNYNSKIGSSIKVGNFINWGNDFITQIELEKHLSQTTNLSPVITINSKWSLQRNNEVRIRIVNDSNNQYTSTISVMKYW